MAKLLTYEQKDTWMDRLCGVTKLIYFLAWSITSMLTYDTRVLAVMLVLSLILFKISKTEWKQVGSIFKFIMFFLVINVLPIPTQLHRITDCINAADTCKNKWKDDRCRTLYTAHQLCLPGHFYSTGLLRIFNFVEIILHIRNITQCNCHRISDVVTDSNTI